ncbi:MAG: DUF3486 family protein [Rhodocyclaceae bacterium]|nr:DUF3486 family protein [Rhodocyclaceae bacterium]
MARRSKVEGLPKGVKEWLDASLVDGNFSGYEQLEAELKARGFDIGKSSIHRYGSAFEQKLATLKLASEQAKAIVTATGDDEGAVSEALMLMVQEHLFKLLNSGDGKFDLPKIARAVADLGRTTVTQKKWQTEVRARAAAAADAAERIAKNGGLSAKSAAEIRKMILGVAA